VKDLDKAAMGKRIRQIRLGAGLRQWELARMLGTTQSAVHKYEHGVVPEPRRLVELAKIGRTSIEWVLTGHHWDNGSETQERLSPEILQTASALREITKEQRTTVDEALGIMREAIRALEQAPEEQAPGYVAALSDSFGEHAGETLRLLESAWKIQRSVLKRVTREAGRRLDAHRAPPGNGSKPDSEDPGGTAAAS
jgi:transcriptional regulator with XRE-family HTH domain